MKCSRIATINVWLIPMNCFTHALPHLDDPYYAVGVCLPDWLSACDRKCRAREKNALMFADDKDPIVAKTAKGVVQHHQDDDWFHKTPAFNELMLNFGMELKEVFGKERTMRPAFIGHVLVELFLDAYLHAQNPGKLDYFYDQVKTVDRESIQQALNRFATRPTEKLAAEIERFARVKYLYDYETDKGTIFRINKVFRALKLELIGDEVFEWMPGARQRVYDRASELLPDGKYPSVLA